jgi:16S rRNA (uracil1498-N3)-methyltransferase
MQRITIDPSQCQGRSLTLTDAQVHYLCRVLRLKPGSSFIAQDGQGHQWQAQLTDDPRQAELVSPLAAVGSAPSKPALILAAALPKQGFDDVVRQATEIGVTEIQPLLSDRTLLKPSPQKLARWQRIAQEASEQSERAIIPLIRPPISALKWLNREPFNRKPTDELLCLCVARGAPISLFAYLKRVLPTAPDRPVTVVIGPEGGWTPTEISVAIKTNHQVVSLGSAILRATTASIVALSIVTALKEDFN